MMWHLWYFQLSERSQKTKKEWGPVNEVPLDTKIGHFGDIPQANLLA